MAVKFRKLSSPSVHVVISRTNDNVENKKYFIDTWV